MTAISPIQSQGLKAHAGRVLASPPPAGQLLPLADGGLLVLGRYTGTARDGGGMLGAETAQMTAAGASDDAAEGIAAFAAKRPPAFRGR